MNQENSDFLKPIFIVGPGRSGSTLLQAMLNSHSELDISKESYFIPALRNVWRTDMSRTEIGDFVELLKQYPRPPEVSLIDSLEWDYGELADMLFEMRGSTWQEIVIAIFTIRTKELNKKYWGNKTPDYGFRLPAIMEVFPQSKIIFLVRDGRDVTLSYQKCDWGPDNFFSGGVYWRRHLHAYQQFRTAFPDVNVLMVRYEDLTGEPEQTLSGICDFIGVDFEPKMLAYYASVDKYFKGDKLKNHQRLKEPTTSERNYLWKREASARDVAIFDGICGTLLECIGYERQPLTLAQKFWSCCGRLYSWAEYSKRKIVKYGKWYFYRLTTPAKAQKLNMES